MQLYYASTIGHRHYAVMTVVCLSVYQSVCLSVCPVLNPNLRTEDVEKLKFGSREDQDS